MPDANRCAVDVGQDDIGNVLDTRHLPWCTNQQLLAIAFDIARTDVGIIALQGTDQVAQCQPIGRQALGVGGNLVLLGKSSDGVDFRHARYIAQLRLDDPVLDHAQVGGRIGTAIVLERAFGGFDRPQENFAKAGRYRPHDCLHPLW
ncbi:hypothetical protein D3C80_1585900 [compost metagenome]